MLKNRDKKQKLERKEVEIVKIEI